MPIDALIIHSRNVDHYKIFISPHSLNTVVPYPWSYELYENDLSLKMSYCTFTSLFNESFTAFLRHLASCQQSVKCLSSGLLSLLISVQS